MKAKLVSKLSGKEAEEFDKLVDKDFIDAVNYLLKIKKLKIE